MASSTAKKTAATKADALAAAAAEAAPAKAPRARAHHMLYREAEDSTPDAIAFAEVIPFGDRVAALEYGMQDRSLLYAAVPSGGSLADVVKAARG